MDPGDDPAAVLDQTRVGRDVAIERRRRGQRAGEVAGVQPRQGEPGARRHRRPVERSQPGEPIGQRPLEVRQRLHRPVGGVEQAPQVVLGFESQPMLLAGELLEDRHRPTNTLFGAGEVLGRRLDPRQLLVAAGDDRARDAGGGFGHRDAGAKGALGTFRLASRFEHATEAVVRVGQLARRSVRLEHRDRRPEELFLAPLLGARCAPQWCWPRL